MKHCIKWDENFKTLDDVVEYVHQIIIDENYSDRSLDDIKNDFNLMTKGNIDFLGECGGSVGEYMILRYLGVYDTNLLPELIRSYAVRESFLEGS